MRWNAFGHLSFEKFLRPSFWKRIKDTFRIINGKSPNNKNKDHRIGVLDYLFPFRAILSVLMSFIYRRVDNNINKGNIVTARIQFTAHSILIIPYILLDAVNFIIAIALTIASLPFIALAHLCIKPKKDKLIEQAMRLKVRIVQHEDDQTFILDGAAIEKELKSVIKEKRIYEKPSIAVKPFFKSDSPSDDDQGPRRSARWYTQQADDRRVLSSENVSLGVIHHSREHGKEILASIKIHPENEKGINALLVLNLFKTKKNIETSDDCQISQIENLCGITH
jgi:hypothetical protein